MSLFRVALGVSVAATCFGLTLMAEAGGPGYSIPYEVWGRGPIELGGRCECSRGRRKLYMGVG